MSIATTNTSSACGRPSCLTGIDCSGTLVRQCGTYVKHVGLIDARICETPGLVTLTGTSCTGTPLVPTLGFNVRVFGPVEVCTAGTTGGTSPADFGLTTLQPSSCAGPTGAPVPGFNVRVTDGFVTTRACVAAPIAALVAGGTTADPAGTCIPVGAQSVTITNSSLTASATISGTNLGPSLLVVPPGAVITLPALFDPTTQQQVLYPALFATPAPDGAVSLVGFYGPSFPPAAIC